MHSRLTSILQMGKLGLTLHSLSKVFQLGWGSNGLSNHLFLIYN